MKTQWAAVLVFMVHFDRYILGILHAFFLCLSADSIALCFSAGNIHVYTNQGASYSQFYQPRRRRAHERREEVVEENQSQVSDSLSMRRNPC